VQAILDVPMHPHEPPRRAWRGRGSRLLRK
jgi:hypothetical protein